MANFAVVEIADFENYPDQEASQATSDVRLAPNLSAQNFSNTGPLVLQRTVSTYTVKGLHPNVATADAPSAVLYSTALAPTVEMASFIRMRLFGSGTDFNAGPAVRIQSDGIGCYAAELTWVAGSPGSYTLQIVRYDTGGTRNVLASLVSAITEYPASSSSFVDRFYAIGIQAIGSGATVTLRAFVSLLYYTGSATLATAWNLTGMTASQTPTLSTTDSSGSRHTSGAHGIRWRAGTLTTASTSRIVSQWGAFIDIAGTKPTAPTVSASAEDNGQRLTLTISGFVDTDPLDNHASTRWLLYPDLGQNDPTFAAPLVDTGFLTDDLLSHTFEDLDPGNIYAARVQLRDSDGDVSEFVSQTTIEMDAHLGIFRMVRFNERVSGGAFPGTSAISPIEPGLFNLGTVFKTARQASGGSSSLARAARFANVSASQTRRFAWRDARLIGSGATPLYNSLMGTLVFVRWPDASGLFIQTRATAGDADAYYVKKQANGSNWEYLVYRRAMATGGIPGPSTGTTGPFTDTLLQTYSVAKSFLGSLYGERVILAHVLTAANAGSIVLFVNGLAFLPVIGSAFQGGLDVGHQYHGVQVDSTNGNWDIYQIGVAAPALSYIPAPEFEVYPEDRDGTGQYHDPGPYMDPFDLGEQNIWFQGSGKWQMKSGSVAARALLIYWAPTLTHYQYSVRAAIYGNNGVVARFTSVDSYVTAYISGSGGTRTLNLEVRVGGSAVFTSSASISYVAGAEVLLQAFNDTNSTDVLMRVFYNGTLILPASGTVERYTNGQNSTVSQGRPGIMRASGLTSSTEDIAGSFEVAQGVTVSPPETPTTAGVSGTSCLKVAIALSSSAFVDSGGDTHSASQWQVIEYPSGSFTSPLFDSGVDTINLTTITVNAVTGTWSDPTDKGLDAATQYQYRVRHRDSSGLWSAWSDPEIFSTSTPATDTAARNIFATYPADPIPSQVFSEIVDFRTLTSTFENGRQQRRAKRTRGVHSFSLRYENLTDAQMDTLWDFYIDHGHGSLNLFNFVNPRTGDIFVCAFRNDSMSRDLYEGVLERTGIELIEVPF